MKTYTIAKIVELVRTKLDEIELNESEMQDLDQDNENLDKVIKSCISEAYKMVSMLADVSMIEGKDASNASLSIDDQLVGRISVPDDFIRLVSVRLSSWSSAKSSAISEDSPEYRMQSNRWVCGTPNRPVAALANGKSGRVLELYKASSANDTLKSFTYVPSVADDAESVDISDQLAGAFIYFIAGLTLVTFREDAADNFFKIGRNLLGLD
jgi:hypothetical protein